MIKAVLLAKLPQILSVLIGQGASELLLMHSLFGFEEGEFSPFLFKS
jgi:hypothetical protein